MKNTSLINYDIDEYSFISVFQYAIHRIELYVKNDESHLILNIGYVKDEYEIHQSEEFTHLGQVREAFTNAVNSAIYYTSNSDFNLAIQHGIEVKKDK